MVTCKRYIIILIATALSISSCKFFRAFSIITKISKTKVVTKANASASLGFEFLSGNIIIHTTILHEGKELPVNLLLDTGAPTTLSEHFAKSNNINLLEVDDVIETAIAGSAKEGKKQHLARDITVRLGAVDVLKPHILVFNLDNFASKCRNIDGFLGADVLSKFSVYINMDNQMITFFDRDAEPDSFKTFPTVLDFKPRPFGKNPIVTLTLDSTDIDFVWDLGFSGSLMVQYPNADSGRFSRMLSGIKHGSYDVYGAQSDANGLDTAHNVENIFAINQFAQEGTGFSFPEQNIQFIQSRKRDETHANIGMELLKHFNMYIDWKSRKICLKNNNTDHSKKITIADFIATYNASSDEFYMAMINTSSVLYGKGLRAGSIIKKIDGADINSLFNKQDLCTLRSELAKKLKTASTMEITQDGVLTDYKLN